MSIGREEVFILVVVLNTAAALLYFLFGVVFAPRRKREDNAPGRERYVIRSIVMLLCPVVGMVFYFLGFLLFRIFFHGEVDISDVIFSKERVKSDQRADEENEMNMAPMEEALAVSDTRSLRTLMLNVIRNDVKESLSAISMALNSNDSETSHYAASVLRDELNHFRVMSQKLFRKISEEEEKEVEECVLLVQYMNSVLVQEALSELEQKKYVLMMDQACDMFYLAFPKRISGEILECMSLRLLEIKEYERCQVWCDRSMELFPLELSTFTAQLKLYFTEGNREAFFKTLGILKKSKIIIDSQTLELIRIFS